MKLRSHLVLLVLAAVVPLLIFSALMLRREYRQQRETLDGGMRDTVRALSLAVDRELASMRAVLETLGDAQYLEQRDFERFYELCVRAARKREGSRIILFDLTGQQLINTLRPFGAPLPNPFRESQPQATDANYPELPLGGPDSIKNAIQTRQPVVSDMFVALSSRRPTVSISYPIARSGRLLYVLEMSFGPEIFTNLLLEQRLPHGSAGVVVDRRGVIVARTINPERFVGRRFTSLSVPMAGAEEVMSIGHTDEGIPLYQSFVRSKTTGWVTGIGVPDGTIEASLNRTMAGSLTGGGAMLLIGLILALKLGKRLSRPISVLAHSAEAIQHGKPVALERPPVWEIAELQHALVAAGAGAREAASEREQRVAAEARQMEAEAAKEKILEREIRLAESEERFRLLLGGIKDYAIFMLDPKGRIATWNSGAEQLTGYASEEALAVSLAILYEGEDTEQQVTYDLQTAQDAPYEQEGWRLRKDGSKFFAHMTLSALRNQDGSLRGFACVIRNITERKRLEEDLKQHVEELKEAERRKDEFLATLSHELRNPIAPIRNAVEILKTSDFGEPKFLWCREVIEQQIAHMARLMEDLLDVGRITQNKLEVRKQIIDLREVIRHALATSSPGIEAAGHRLTVILPPESMPLYADSTRLTQAFVNLLNNAAKYMDKNGQIWLGVKVLPAVSRQATDSTYPPLADGEGLCSPALGQEHTVDREAVVRIRDNGIGISADLLPRIFDAFTQADAASEHSKGGLGIGLTLARHLIALHGGTIEAESEGPGKGSEFVVRLPLAEHRKDMDEERHPDPAAAPSIVPLKRILVVDDARVQAKSLCMLLELMGFEVRMAHNGPSALAAAQEFYPEVALIDIGLPGMNGYELALRMRQVAQLKNIVLIAQTGWGRDEDREQSRQAGFDYHLTKPIDHQLLENILKGAAKDAVRR